MVQNYPIKKSFFDVKVNLCVQNYSDQTVQKLHGLGKRRRINIHFSWFLTPALIVTLKHQSMLLLRSKYVSLQCQYSSLQLCLTIISAIYIHENPVTRIACAQGNIGMITSLAKNANLSCDYWLDWKSL